MRYPSASVILSAKGMRTISTTSNASFTACLQLSASWYLQDP
jgi:hypothetical protein